MWKKSKPLGKKCPQCPENMLDIYTNEMGNEVAVCEGYLEKGMGCCFTTLLDTVNEKPVFKTKTIARRVDTKCQRCHVRLKLNLNRDTYQYLLHCPNFILCRTEPQPPTLDDLIKNEPMINFTLPRSFLLTLMEPEQLEKLKVKHKKERSDGLIYHLQKRLK